MNKYKGFYKVGFLSLLLLAVLMAGCGGGGNNGSGGGGNYATPTVTFTDPANGDTGVALNTKIAATFSEPMNPATIKTNDRLLQSSEKCQATFIVTGPGTTPVIGTVSYAGLIATFTPESNLEIDTTYTATITTGAKAVSGRPLAANYTWTFTTGAAPDTVPPTVTFTDPSNGDIGVPTNKKIAATFSKGMDNSTLNTTTFTLTGPGSTPVLGTVTNLGLISTFTPNSDLAFNTIYTATITTGAKSLAGIALATNYTWTYTTGDAPDTTPPTVTSTDPATGETGVALNRNIAATFSEGMDPATITNLTYTVTGPGLTPVIGTVTYVGLVATFNPTGDLASDTTYTATITTGARDLAGNALAANYTWTFRTGAAPDTTPPTVTFTDPATDAIDVPTNQNIAATFSKGMNPATITNSNYTLTGPGSTPVIGTVTYVGLIATFNPTSDLAFDTTYTATITTAVRDLAGNHLATNYTWSFTTGAEPDTTPPTVTLVNPANSTTDVALNKSIAATFDKGMNPATITNLNYTIAGVPGTVTYDAITHIATFKPTSNFATNTTYTATISTGVSDLAGNHLAAPYTWSFTTGVRIVPEAVALGAATPFGGFGGGAGMTNQGILTVVNGDIGTTGVSTLITGFHDRNNVYTETTHNIGAVSGTIYTADTGATIAAAGARDARIAYNNLTPASLPGGIDLGTDNLAGLTLAPGIYQAAGGSYRIVGDDLTLDAQGDPNAVWVFQMASSLTVGGPGAAFPQSVILINGAQPKNVFWQVGSAATINAGGGGVGIIPSTMVGTIIAEAGVTFSTVGADDQRITILNGRALGLSASVTLVNTVVNIPAP